MERILILGGGIAGLSAAVHLAPRYEVLVIEARDRLGGRIHTLYDGVIPVELGAEFVHGKSPVLFKLIKDAGLVLHRVPDKHWRYNDGSLYELRHFWEILGGVTEQIDPAERDKSFATFLKAVEATERAKNLSRDFVEGFHAAPFHQAGIQVIRKSEESSEEISGQEQFRITAGYGRLVEYYIGECHRLGVKLKTGAEVLKIEWKPGKITVKCRLAGSLEDFIAQKAVITLPIEILKKLPIEPPIESKSHALKKLAGGTVFKIGLLFRSRFWPEPNFGFIHCKDEPFQAWWADERGNILTGWSGGPKGEILSKSQKDATLETALRTLARIFGESLPKLRKSLVRFYSWNWSEDPFAGAAYTYALPGGKNAAVELSKPVQQTLYFAGEATDHEFQLGTVHGAIQSGMRASGEILEKD